MIPARDEGGSIEATVSSIEDRLARDNIPFEIVVVDDHSKDDTADKLKALAARYGNVRRVENLGAPGFGLAIRRGLDAAKGDAVAIVMADGSDDPDHVALYFRKLQEGYDCVFGSRFMKGSKVVDYPPHKLAVNRLANLFIRLLFRLDLNDVTNAFKAYRMSVIRGLQPLLSNHFNLTVELPLKAIVRGYSYTVVPIAWYNRKHGVSKLKIKEMGSRYLFIVLYVLLEKHLSRGDYRRAA